MDYAEIKAFTIQITTVEGEIRMLRSSVDALRADIGNLPCDIVRTEKLPDIERELGKLQVYQFVTWTILLVMMGGVLTLAWKILQAGIIL